MIDENELLKSLDVFDDERQLEKDYLLNLILKIFSTTTLSEHAVFKGGTAISYFYGLDRFSEDLDFTYMAKKESDTEIFEIINKSIRKIIEEYNSSYVIRKNKTEVLGKTEEGLFKDIRNEFFIEGPLFKRTRKRNKIKLEISLRMDLVEIPKMPERFVSKYRDIGSMLLYVMNEKEILVEKACAIIERNKARDLYDAYFLIKYRKAKFDYKLFVKKIKLRNENFGLEDLKLKVLKVSEKLWKEELSYLLKTLPELSEVKKVVLNEIIKKEGIK